MRESIPDLIINKAVDIWCMQLLNPVFDNGDNSYIGEIASSIAISNIQADKEAAGSMVAIVEDFRKILTDELVRIRDNPTDEDYFPRWLGVDYGPCRVLSEAANKAGIPKSQFSCKSSVEMDSDKVSVSFGYTAPTTHYYPLPDGRWLLTSITADANEMNKIFTSVMAGNPLGLLVEGTPEECATTEAVLREEQRSREMQVPVTPVLDRIDCDAKVKRKTDGFIVTEKAQRPANMNGCCFYCQQPIGSQHKPGCVLITKDVKARMTVEYKIKVPANWDKDMIEFYRNEGSWCASNAIDELEKAFGDMTDDCMCNAAWFEYLGGDSAPFLNED